MVRDGRGFGLAASPPQTGLRCRPPPSRACSIWAIQRERRVPGFRLSRRRIFPRVPSSSPLFGRIPSQSIRSFKALSEQIAKGSRSGSWVGPTIQKRTKLYRMATSVNSLFFVSLKYLSPARPLRRSWSRISRFPRQGPFPILNCNSARSADSAAAVKQRAASPIGPHDPRARQRSGAGASKNSASTVRQMSSGKHLRRKSPIHQLVCLRSRMGHSCNQRLSGAISFTACRV